MRVPFVWDELFQAADRIVQAGLNRSSGDSHPPRDFFDFEIVVIPQYNHSTVFRRELLHRFGYLHGLGYLVGGKILLRCLRRTGLDRLFSSEPLDQPRLFTDAPM